MADEERVGIFRAILRYVTFYKWRKERAILRAANKQFTSSAEGIRDAFEIHADTMKSRYNELRDAVAQVESVSEGKRAELDSLNQEEKKMLELRDGALRMAEQAQEKGDTEGLAKHKAAFSRYQTRIDEIEARQAKLDQEIRSYADAMKKHMMGLTKLQSEIQNLPKKKAEAIADFVTAKSIIELNDRLQGLQTSMESGPIDAVLQANQELTAKARISDKLAGTDAALQDEEYAQAGKVASSDEAFEKMLAARKAERNAKTGMASPQVQDRDDRPKI